jgi:hypothetical protein
MIKADEREREKEVKTCDTCSFWKKFYPEDIDGHCSNKKLNSDPSDKGNEDCALGGEPADWTGISTGPKFGCIHHSLKAVIK